MFNTYLTALPYWHSFKLGNISIEEFFKKMKEDGCFPCKSTWFNRQDWTIIQTVLIYHNWEPSMFENIYPEDLYEFVKFIDQEHDIHGLLKNYIPSDLFSNSNHLRTEKILQLFQKKYIEIPKHFPIHLSNENKIEYSKNDFSVLLTTQKPLRRDSMRIQIVQQSALLWWAKEKAENTIYTKPFDLARSEEFKQLVQVINSIGGLSPVIGEEYSQSGVDPEWFSHLYPGNDKPGPKGKKSNRTKKTNALS